jgi:hypothetical protein
VGAVEPGPANAVENRFPARTEVAVSGTSLSFEDVEAPSPDRPAEEAPVR